MKKHLGVVDYSEKSFVVFGELTRKYKKQLGDFGGKFNKKLKEYPHTGWIFSKKNEEKIMQFVNAVNTGSYKNFENSQSSMPAMSSISSVGLPTIPNPSTLDTSNKYQYVKFKVFRPRDGMKVRLTTDGKNVEGSISKIESSNNDGVIDTVYINFEGQTSLGVICRGKWQIFGYFENHSLYFH